GFIVGLVVFAAVVHVALAWMFRDFAAAERRKKESRFPIALETDAGRALPPEPRLEAIEPRRGGSEEVGRGAPPPPRIDPNGYGWVDRDKGIAHVPLDVAAERALQSGTFKVRDKAAGPGDGPPSDSSSGRRPWGAAK